MLAIKKVLLIGRMDVNVPPAEQMVVKNVELFAATSLEAVQAVFKEQRDQIDIVILGAGINLEERLEIVRYIFTASDSTTVHMKDKASGP